MAFGSASKARFDSVYISPETLLNRRDISRRIFPRYRDNSIFHILWHSGRKKRTVQTKFNHFEKGFLKEVAISAGATGGTATNPVVVTLDAASHTEGGTLSPGQVGQEVMLGSLRGWIQTKNTTTNNAHVLTIKPVNATDVLSAQATAGKIIVFLSSAYADGTGFGDSEVRKPDNIYNFTQIFKNTFRVDGSEAANEQESTVKGNTRFYWNDLVTDTSNLHMMEKEFAYLFGERSEYVTDSNNANKKVYMTGGLDYFVENHGMKHQYTTFALTDVHAIIKKLNKERAPKNQMGLLGIDLQLDFDAAIRALNASNVSGGALDFSAHGKAKGKFKAADFSFNSWSVGDYTFHYKSYDAMDYKPVSGYDIGGETAEWPSVGFLIPLATVRNANPEGAEDDRVIPTIRIRYKSNGGVTRSEGIKHFKRDIKIHGIDMCEWDWISEDGIQFAGTNQFLKIHK